MPTAVERLAQLQAEMNRANMPHWSVEEMRRLSFFEVGGLLHVEYYGLTWREYDWDEEEEEEEEVDEDRLPLFETLAMPEVASRVASLTFDGPDEGANGTRDWDFGWLLAQDVTFPELKTLIIRPSQLEAHNFTVISGPAGGYEESGALAQWLSKAPKLWQLTTPSAPNAEFFEVEHEPLYSMRVDAGYDAQDFILNLSRQPGPFVWNLDWNEVHNFHMDMWDEGATSFEQFEALFSSPACPDGITLRNPKLSEKQVKKLAALQRETRRGWTTSLKVFFTSYGLSSSNHDDGFWIEREASERWRNSVGNEGDR